MILSRETAILTAAAGQAGRIDLPAGMKPGTGQRILGQLLRDGLAEAPDGKTHRLTQAGYRAVGLEPPAVSPASKQVLVLGLIGRQEGASLPELVAATGWLPHTTRAVLSRLRSAGRELTREARPDGIMTYRLAAPAPARPTRRARRPEATTAC